MILNVFILSMAFPASKKKVPDEVIDPEDDDFNQDEVGV